MLQSNAIPHMHLACAQAQCTAVWAQSQLLLAVLTQLRVQFLTSAFCHHDFNHLSSNAFMLYVFGRIVEEEEGAPGVIGTYLVTAIGEHMLDFSDVLKYHEACCSWLEDLKADVVVSDLPAGPRTTPMGSSRIVSYACSGHCTWSLTRWCLGKLTLCLRRSGSTFAPHTSSLVKICVWSRRQRGQLLPGF